MNLLSQANQSCFDLILETFVPAFRHPRSLEISSKLARQESVAGWPDLDDLNVATLLESGAGSYEPSMKIAMLLFDRLISPSQKKAVDWILYLLTTSYGTVLLSSGRYRVPFTQLSARDRELFFAGWSQSHLTPKRLLSRTFRQIAVMSFFGSLDDQGQNPFWPCLKYPGPPMAKTPNSRRLLKKHAFKFIDDRYETSSDKEEVLEYDAVIVGSGAGGGIAAAELASKGFKVLVIEKGSFNRTPELKLLEFDYMTRMCENGGLVPADDGSINILAGSTFGGGTTINWSASLVPPSNLREEWARDHGIDWALSQEFQCSVERVVERIGVTSSKVVHNVPNQILMDGCNKLGYPVATIPQNTAGQEHKCGFCGMGCPTATKQGTMETYLLDASMNGAEFLCNCNVDEILWDKGGKVASGVRATVKKSCYDGSVSERKLFIKAKVVICSAGALNTPALLLRSGFTNRNIGRHLRLHPVSIVAGYFPDIDVRPYDGAIMTAISTVAENPDGRHYGCRLEVPWAHPLLTSLVMPFMLPKEDFLGNSKTDHTIPRAGLLSKLQFTKYSSVSGIIVLQRDFDSEGSVSIDSAGRAVVKFSLGHQDRRSMQEGIKKACNVLVAAGASQVVTLIEGMDPYSRTDAKNDQVIMEPKYKQFLDSIDRNGLHPVYNSSLFSAHQMGTCRLSTSPFRGACNTKGQLWECGNVWVCDGSLLPTASGVNPMMTIMSCADYVSRQISSYLKTVNNR